MVEVAPPPVRATAAPGSHGTTAQRHGRCHQVHMGMMNVARGLDEVTGEPRDHAPGPSRDETTRA